MKPQNWIEIIGARQHNLKNISLRIPNNALTVVTGPSGSGKSSLAFNTLFAEGQRRYMESLSTYARQFLEKHEKPEVDNILGLRPTIALEQKNHTKNSRSTVGTATEIYDYLRLLFAKMGTMYSPKTGEPIKRNVVRDILRELFSKHSGQRLYIVFPIEFGPKSKIQDRKRLFLNLLERGFSRVICGADVFLNAELNVLEIQEEILKKNSNLYGKAGKSHQVYIMTDRCVIDEDSRGRMEDAFVQAYSEGFGRSRAFVVNENGRLTYQGVYTDFPSTSEGETRFPELTPLLFSFNSPMGACETCKGFGNILKIDPKLVIPHTHFSISQGAVEPLMKPSAKDWLKQLLVFCQKNKISIHTPWEKLPEKDKERIWKGSGDFQGIEGMFAELDDQKYKIQVKVFLSRYRSPVTCESCKGHRIRLEARHVFVHGMSIGDLASMTIEKLADWFEKTSFNETEREMGKDLFPQIKNRLSFLLRVGLEYLSLDRLAKTLSGGEAQRIALANQLGSRLTQTCYILDEPSIGLHPRDTDRLIGILKDLALLRNTVVVVEHDPDLIKNAEYILDIGPNAGENGGELLFQGSFEDFTKQKDLTALSSTASFIQQKENIPVPMRRRMDRFQDKNKLVHWVELNGCKENNLQSVDLKIPHGMLTCVTGVSGSGKSSAIRKTLYPALAKILLSQTEEVGRFDRISGFEGLKGVVLVDQQPIGRSPRSNPVTFMKAFDEIRNLFANTGEARKKHYHPGYFSFNVPGGRCETCEGDGYIRVEMVFMEDMFVLCDVCQGKRFKAEVLDIKYEGKNVHDVLQMTVTEARKFFRTETKLCDTLGILERVGLGYIRLGQPATTLSGGESQRLKIARELSVKDNRGNLYILDEPTTGLHFRDVKVLIRVLNELVEAGNTVVVIEHNLDMMKSSDWIIDFGPEGGNRGGQIVFEGTPEDLVKNSKGFTAHHLKPVLAQAPKVSVPELFGTA